MPLSGLKNIPWKIIASSADMMDVNFGNRRFPYNWRSSLAISVYEPSDEETENNCEQRLAFIKVTCSLTGYQPNGSESDGEIQFGDVPLEELGRLTNEYLGCYGALLNVAVMPVPGRVSPANPDLSTFPRILDFSPKSRELIRSITEGGELLTGSSRNITIDQSLTNTEKNETSVGVEAGLKAGIGGGGGAGDSESGGGGAKAEASAEVTAKAEHTWGSSLEEKSSLGGGSSEEERITERYSTTMDQLYSLLTGYHTGTNRGTVLILARPGTLQPTRMRTFAPGLRMLEGVQDFIFLVSRPREQDSLCIEAVLNTGHFPENILESTEEDEWEYKEFTFTVRAFARGGQWGAAGSGETVNFGSADRPQDRYDLQDGWVVNREAPGTIAGIREGEDRTRVVPSRMDDPLLYDPSTYILVTPVSNFQVQAQGRLVGRGGWDFTTAPDTHFERDFIIHARRRKVNELEPTADRNRMLVTTRALDVCYQADNGCPNVIEPPAPINFEQNRPEWMEIEGVNFARSAPLEQTYSGIRSALITGASAATRKSQTYTLAETDYFNRRLAAKLPKNFADIPLTQFVKLDNYADRESLIHQISVRQFLNADRRTLSKIGVDKNNIVKLRGEVLQRLEKAM